MAGIVGNTTAPVIYGAANPALSTELNDLEEAVTALMYYDVRYQPVSVRYGNVDRMPAANNWGIRGTIEESFKGDYYERIHVQPSRIDLGTVASTVNRNISVWNAYTTQSATLDAVLINNGSGISAVGDPLPYIFTPLTERIWEVRITPNGPPEINAQILFDFAEVADPLPVVIVGNRAVVLPAVPNVPVRERWRWLTDVHVSWDGTEQRVALRGVPRRSLSTSLVFESEAEVRDQYKTLLSAAGRLFVPYFQYATITTEAAAAGDTVLAFNTAYCDLRDEDYVLLLLETGAVLIQLDAIGTASATTMAPLSVAIPKGTKVISIFPSILPNNLSMSRAAVNHYATATMSSDATYPRSVTRQGVTTSFNTLDGYFVLERRPLANNDVDHSFDTGQEILDSQTGLFDVATDWDFTKVETGYSWRVQRIGRYVCQHRTGIDEMDYWRKFADEMKGSFNTFLLSTYRPDQVLASPVGLGADSIILSGPSYVDNFWPALAYHYLALYTDAGIHYAKVIAATKNEAGDCAVTFAPALPNAADWAQVNQVSYLLKQRISGDEIEWEHYQLDSIIKFSVRTVKE